MIPQQSMAPSLAVTQHVPANGTANGHAAAPEVTVASPAATYVQLLADIGVSAGPDEPFPHVIGLTSCERGEGVSTVAANLAWVAARSQGLSVLLVDAHIAAPALAKLANLTAAKGLTDFLSSQVELSECIHKGKCPRLSYLPVGHQTTTDALWLQNLTALFESVRENYDLIVLDLPPISDWNNCASFAQHADGILLVVGSEKISPPIGRSALARLHRDAIEVLGVVLNGVN
jgi:capsular exopolysaccharide synthesis family protein